MHPIVQGILSLLVGLGVLVAFLEYAKRSGKGASPFSYRRIGFLTIVVISFGVLFYYLAGFMNPTPRAEGRIALSAVLCWIPLYGIAFLDRKRNKKRCP